MFSDYDLWKLAAPPEYEWPDDGSEDEAHMEALIEKLEAENERLRVALEPFAAAWAVARNYNVTMTYGDLGAIAKHHVDGVHFKHASEVME